MVQSNYSKHGTVSIETKEGRLRLRLPRSLYEGKQKYITLGLADTEENRAIAEAKRALCERDIKLGMFDETFNKYKPGTHLTVVETLKPKEVPKLDELWERFLKIKQPQCSQNTMDVMYAQYSRYIAKLPTTDLSKASEIRDWILANLPMNSAKRFLVRLNACIELSQKDGLIDSNPFAGMAKDVKAPKSERKTEDEDINPFSAEEREVIIKALEANQFTPKKSAFPHSFYAPFVRFLFSTGCRPSEAIALRWFDVGSDNKIDFNKRIIFTAKGRVEAEGLKTQERRKFPCNASMRALLQAIKPENCKPEDLIFPGYKGGFLDYNSFRKNVWKDVLKGLDIEDRRLYQTRHTFITLALETRELEVKDVARLVGNSPEVIYRHYAGNKRELFVPEF